ncbi:hypothetical protein D0862_13311 [Hortaea werneckii]|uniref:Fungal N-terminal domain-containing protein n=1 Tax=Hortaea werneckii TaxID=91943 RepID=A0A3M7ER87_HORWE|nr:hypothetical protein D0862_13311 [Hortaea werneckii]
MTRTTDTMPTGLEEASAILTFVQVGFTLARTFTTLIGEYQEAPDELATLANAIVDTLAHIETIKRLLEENETTHGWNANGIDLAASCLEEAERLVKRIVTLLRKSGADIPPNDRIGPEDISISVMRRVAWSRFTGRSGKINESLAATRQKMLLILTLYRAFTVDSQEQQRLARDRVIVLVRGRQIQRARRKYLGQHSNMPSNAQRAIRDEQEDYSVAQGPTGSLETSQEVENENAPETTAAASRELPVRLDVSDEAGNALCIESTRSHSPNTHASCGTAETTSKETQEASDSPGESRKAVNSPTVFLANRPADDESTPTAVESQSDPSVGQEKKCPSNSGESTIENLVVTACAMDDAVLLQFGEAFNPPLTADQVRKLLQKAPLTTKEVANESNCENEDPRTLHQHSLSPSREHLPQVDTDVDEDNNGARRAESVAPQSICKTAQATKTRFLKTFLSRLIRRKKVAASLSPSTRGSFAGITDDDLVEVSKQWHLGKWALTKRIGFQSMSHFNTAHRYSRFNELISSFPAPTASSLAPPRFVSFFVTLGLENCTIVPAHLSRDELNRLLWHATANTHKPEANLTSQIYASLPAHTYRTIDRLLRNIVSRGHEIIYAEVMGLGSSKAERMTRRKLLNSGITPIQNKILLVFQERQKVKVEPEIEVCPGENQPRADETQSNEDQVDPSGPVRVHRVNDGANHTDPVQEMMRVEQMKKMKREREIVEEEKMKKEKEREATEKKKIEEEQEEQEKKRREDAIDNDEEEELYGNVLGLGDDELVQRLLEMYTNMRSSLDARSDEAANVAQGHGTPP